MRAQHRIGGELRVPCPVSCVPQTMIDFELTAEQQALVDMARKFALNEIRPVAAVCDRDSTFPLELFRKAWENGLMNEFVPQEFGGLGLSLVETCLLIEELAYGCPGIATSLFCNTLALAPILVGGSEEQKKRVFKKFSTNFTSPVFASPSPTPAPMWQDWRLR